MQSGTVTSWPRPSHTTRAEGGGPQNEMLKGPPPISGGLFECCARAQNAGSDDHQSEESQHGRSIPGAVGAAGQTPLRAPPARGRHQAGQQDQPAGRGARGAIQSQRRGSSQPTEGQNYSPGGRQAAAQGLQNIQDRFQKQLECGQECPEAAERGGQMLFRGEGHADGRGGEQEERERDSSTPVKK